MFIGMNMVKALTTAAVTYAGICSKNPSHKYQRKLHVCLLLNNINKMFINQLIVTYIYTAEILHHTKDNPVNIYVSKNTI